jgi:hypothetical protein
MSRTHEDLFEATLSSFQTPSIAKANDLVHDGWGEVFGDVTNNNSFENEDVTIELEGLGLLLANVIGSATY